MINLSKKLLFLYYFEYPFDASNEIVQLTISKLGSTQIFMLLFILNSNPYFFFEYFFVSAKKKENESPKSNSNKESIQTSISYDSHNFASDSSQNLVQQNSFYDDESE